jgi:hypothetical protein
MFDLLLRYSSHLSGFGALLRCGSVAVIQHDLGRADRGIACSGRVRASIDQLSAPMSRECWASVLDCGSVPYSIVVMDACSQRFSRVHSECAVERANSLLNACAIGLQCLSQGGCLVIRLSDALSRLTAGVLMLLTSLFRDAHVMRPQSCKPHSSESFVFVPSPASLAPFFPMIHLFATFWI